MLSLKPQLDAAGYKLVVVSIGYPDGGKEFWWVPFPMLEPQFRAAVRDVHSRPSSRAPWRW